MLIPSCILLWHGLAASLEPVAAKEWKAAASIANRHGVDLNQPPALEKAVPDEQNFLGHPYLKEIIFQKPEVQGTELQALFKVINPHLPAIIDGGDQGQTADFMAILEALDAEFPSLLEKAEKAKSPAGKVLGVLEQTGIPWKALATAAARPAAQLPPEGTTAPDDDFTNPRTHQIFPVHLIGFMSLAGLYSMAALESGNLEKARASLLVQMRIVDAFTADETITHFALGYGFMPGIFDQLRNGMVRKRWTPADMDWIHGWLCRTPVQSQLEAALKKGIFDSMHEIGYLSAHPAAWDRQFSFIKGTLETETLGSLFAPFSQDWLLMFRGRSELLFHLSPPALFQLWRAHVVRSWHKKEMKPLSKGGLLALAFPDEPDPSQSNWLRREVLALTSLKMEARQNLWRTSHALALWQAKHQDFPETLAALPPMQIGDYTSDPFDTVPLRYERLSPTAYRLYSVGTDLSDNSGEPIQDDEGDICWHLP